MDEQTVLFPCNVCDVEAYYGVQMINGDLEYFCKGHCWVLHPLKKYRKKVLMDLG